MAIPGGHWPWASCRGLPLSADVVTQPWPWYVLAAALWLLALAPWVVHSLWIYLTPRRDGKPG
jgi:uncharacterized protein involved in response to NO